MHHLAYLVMWLFFFGLDVSALFVGYSGGYVSLEEIMRQDNTGTTLFIIAYFLLGFCFSVSNIIWLYVTAAKDATFLAESADLVESKYQQRQNIMYYFLGILPVLGFIGTLVGFMLVANLFEHNIAGETDLTKIVAYILQSVAGIKTAAFTSIVGLLASWVALYPLDLIFRNGYLSLVVDKANSGKGK